MYAQNLDDGDMILQYIRMFMLDNTLYTNDANGEISYSLYKHRLFVISVDCTASQTDLVDRLPLIKRGELRAHLKFKNASSNAWTLLCFGQCPALLAIDKNRNVQVDYAQHS